MISTTLGGRLSLGGMAPVTRPSSRSALSPVSAIVV